VGRVNPWGAICFAPATRCSSVPHKGQGIAVERNRGNRTAFTAELHDQLFPIRPSVERKFLGQTISCPAANDQGILIEHANQIRVGRVGFIIAVNLDGFRISPNCQYKLPILLNSKGSRSF